MKKIAALIMIRFFFTVKLLAQGEKPIYEIHAAMIYNFLKYIQWPDDGSPEFVVGVLGEDNVFNTLKNYYEGKPKGSKKFVIKKLTDVSESVTSSVVYIGKGRSNDFENVKNIVTGKPILTITDSSNLGKKGSCINFKVIDDKLKFEINQAAINSNNLRVAGQLISMAILL